MNRTIVPDTSLVMFMVEIEIVITYQPGILFCQIFQKFAYLILYTNFKIACDGGNFGPLGILR
jgi:hypothetical protein